VPAAANRFCGLIARREAGESLVEIGRSHNVSHNAWTTQKRPLMRYGLFPHLNSAK